VLSRVSRVGVLEVGDVAPDCTLLELATGQYHWLSQCLARTSNTNASNNRKNMTLLLAGSFS
jgi:hypothetical protein